MMGRILFMKKGDARGAPARQLPDGYTELAGVSVADGAYFNTGVNPNQNTRVVLDASVTLGGTSSVGLFGARDASKTNCFCVFVSTTKEIQNDYGSTVTTGVLTIQTGRHLFDKNKNVLFVDRIVARADAETTFSCACPMYLMWVNSGGVGAGVATPGTVYSCQIYDGNEIIRDYVPCITDGGKVGLFDRVGWTFYGNAGGGTITGVEVA